MFYRFELKTKNELTWDDIPYIEHPTFAWQHTIDAVMGHNRSYSGVQILNLDEFKRSEVPHYDPLFNHDAVSDHLHYLFDYGIYFSVGRHGIPFAASFRWRELNGHPENGEWFLHHRGYPEVLSRQLEDLAKRLGAKKRRMLAEQAEADANPVGFASNVRRAIERRGTERAEPKNITRSKIPRSIDDCHARLGDARERLVTDGYKSKYTDEEILALAKTGELDDRFVVRLIQTKYAGDADYLGQMNNGEVKYWSTTFNQMENADTDPKTLCGLIGVDYDPKKTYTLVIVDTQAIGAGQSVTIVPTHKNLGEFAKSEIKGINPDAVDQVMTPEYNLEYAEHMMVYKIAGGDINKDKEISDYANANFFDREGKVHFRTRMKINARLGANEHYTGDGATKNLIAGCPNECGVMETFTYDKNPQTLSKLEAGGSAKRIATKPL